MDHYPKVLIADDDDGVRDMIVAIVRNTLPSARIIAVDNGKKALDSYKRSGADLIISNFVMPEMDGPAFVGIVRSSNDTVPIIMVSGSPEAEALGKQAGIDRFVNKLEIMERLPKEIMALMGSDRVLCLNRFLNG